jgi:hypothetical protein
VHLQDGLVLGLDTLQEARLRQTPHLDTHDTT